MCVTGLRFAGNLTSFTKEETWAQRGEMSCLVSQPVVNGVRIEVPRFWSGAYHTRAQRMAYAALATGPFGIFLGGSVARL